jgi:transcription initiation factor TFIIIB Brf1 subunit/transcription initiation factor TFIIB
LECPECKGIIVSPFWSCGEKVCSACGLVLSESSTTKAESFTRWNPRWYSNWYGDDSETLKEWLTTLRTVSSQLSLPSLPYREEAARTIRKENKILFQSQKFGKNKRATVAALLHLILKQYGKNRSIQEMCKQLSLDSKLVIKQAWALNKTIITSEQQFIGIPRKTSTDYLFEYGGKITSDTKLLVEAREILKKIRRLGGNPIALAAGALYNVCKNKKRKATKEQIGEAFGISHRTVYTNEAQIRRRLKHVGVQKTRFALIPRIPLSVVEQRRK